ncbi:hypothetical protein [Pseudomonas syringae group genomosp. 7]
MFSFFVGLVVVCVVGVVGFGVGGFGCGFVLGLCVGEGLALGWRD